MDNPEAYAALGTNNTARRQTNQNTKHRILQRLASRIPDKNPEVNPGPHER